MAKKQVREGSVFDRLYEMGRKRSRSVYSQRSTSPSLSIPDSPSRPDSPMSTISEPPWATFSTELPISSELEQFFSPATLGEIIQQLRDEEEKKDTIIEQYEEEFTDEENEGSVTNIELKLPEQQ